MLARASPEPEPESKISSLRDVPSSLRSEEPSLRSPRPDGEGAPPISEKPETIPQADTPPQQPKRRKQSASKADRGESDQALLDRITDLWNPWARAHGAPVVEELTDRRAVACRRRIDTLLQPAYIASRGYDTAEAAFAWILRKCDQSFFARGSPRKPLEFDQLMQESFIVRMAENAFEYKDQAKGNGRWAR
jgi:hypothetical protein